jgi:hypothetical protein
MLVLSIVLPFTCTQAIAPDRVRHWQGMRRLRHKLRHKRCAGSQPAVRTERNVFHEERPLPGSLFLHSMGLLRLTASSSPQECRSRRTNAGPSTPFAAENAANSAQDVRINATRMTYSGNYTKPRFVVLKLPMAGSTVGNSAAVTPNHCASVAAYCELAVLGTQRPFEPESSGPPSASVGYVP